mmetsp:Transcript_107603/g.332329  ORF Transcript_107603/g.332329 Transcript_107603/m.332329 type:complete len:247 (+) Transcript_107603:131-871(+)
MAEPSAAAQVQRAGGSPMPPIPLGPNIGKLRWFGTLLPVAYVWALPLLSTIGWAHKCPHWPRCWSTGASVSDFIANTHATGAMAAVFFFPSMHLWLNVQHIRHHRCVLPTLVVFQVCFGLFLMCPVSEVPSLHGWAVLVFCTSALVHYGIILRFCAEHRYRQCQVTLCIAIASFALIFLLVVVSRFDRTLIPTHVPFLFYFCEAVGLSSMAVFPVLWYIEQRVPTLQSFGVTVDGRELAAHAYERT